MNDQNASAIQAKQVAPRVTAGDARLSRISRGLLASLGVAFVLVSAPALAAAPPLGLVEQFGVLGSAGITAAAPTTVSNGDVGSATTVTGAWNTTPPYTVHAPADAIVVQALIDATAASTNLGLQGPGTPLPAQLGGTTLGPGVYSFAVSADIAAGPGPGSVLTLSGAGSYVFIVPTSLTANVLSSVNLIGVDPCQVFWQVGSTATLNGLNFPGTVIAGAAGAGSVTIGSGNLNGRAVSLTAAVTTAGPANNITACSLNAPLVIGSALPTVSKSFSPATIAAGGTSTLTLSLSNTSTTLADTITSLTDNLPSGMVIAATPNASTTCSGGSVTAPAGGSTVTLTGGTIPVATLSPATTGSCTVSVNVTAATTGSLVNTVAANGLVTNNGNNAAPASATLIVSSLAAATGIPTLSEWAMIMLTALLAITGFVTMRRQAR